MTIDSLFFRNLAVYVLVALVNMACVVLASLLAAHALPQFRPGEPLESASIPMMSLLAIVIPALTTWLASNRPMLGREKLAVQVDHLEDSNIDLSHMVIRDVGSKREADTETRHALAATQDKTTTPVDHTTTETPPRLP